MNGLVNCFQESDKETLFEKNPVMAKLNEGDVVEGLFTIGLALYLAYGKIDKKELNRIRTKIDSKIFDKGRFKYEVVGNLKRQIKGKPPDFINVGFEMRLKPKSVPGVFGKDFLPLYEKSQDIGNLDKKIDQLITHIKTANFSRRANSIITRFLNNDTTDNIWISIIADGIAGEASGGEVKGDVEVHIDAVTKRTRKKLTGGSIAYSLKSESVTVANLAPYKGMLSLATALGITWNAKEKYIRLSQPFRGLAEQKVKFAMITSMYNDLKKEIKIKSRTQRFSIDAMGFLRESIFGSDLADVVDIQRGTLKEITVENFDKMSETMNLSIIEKGNNLLFTDEKRIPIFQIRTKLRPPPANEAKFYLEVGKGIYTHD